jgi:type IV pilus assembly protein PilB
VTEKQAFIDVLLASQAIDASSLAQFCSETFAYPSWMCTR